MIIEILCVVSQRLTLENNKARKGEGLEFSPEHPHVGSFW